MARSNGSMNFNLPKQTWSGSFVSEIYDVRMFSRHLESFLTAAQLRLGLGFGGRPLRHNMPAYIDVTMLFLLLTRC